MDAGAELTRVHIGEFDPMGWGGVDSDEEDGGWGGGGGAGGRGRGGSGGGGGTPLIVAARQGQQKMVELLLRRGSCIAAPATSVDRTTFYVLIGCLKC